VRACEGFWQDVVRVRKVGEVKRTGHDDGTVGALVPQLRDQGGSIHAGQDEVDHGQVRVALPVGDDGVFSRFGEDDGAASEDDGAARTFEVAVETVPLVWLSSTMRMRGDAAVIRRTPLAVEAGGQSCDGSRFPSAVAASPHRGGIPCCVSGTSARTRMSHIRGGGAGRTHRRRSHTGRPLHQTGPGHQGSCSFTVRSLFRGILVLPSAGVFDGFPRGSEQRSATG
jgi:hypothetical protein